jgi:hypothetical protein
MHASNPDFSDLFAQLGLPSTQADITRFVRLHASLPNHVGIAEAPFWTETQKAFLLEQMRLDAEWAMLVDELNVQLHEKPAAH